MRKSKLQQFLLALLGIIKTEVFVCFFCRRTAARRALEESEFEQVGLIDLFDRCLLFRGRRRDRGESGRAAAEFLNKNGEQMPVGLRKTYLIDLEQSEGFFDGMFVKHAFFDLRKITGSLQKIIRRTRSKTAS